MSYNTLNYKFNNIDRCILKVLEALGKDNSRLVGGYVRDRLLKLSPSDVDIAVNVSCYSEVQDLLRKAGIIQDLLRKAGIKPLTVLEAHGTVIAEVDGRRFECTPLKTTGKGGHDIWRQDASTRDFSINALYADWTGTIYDYYNGYNDLMKKPPHLNPLRDIKEEPKNILRFFRFQSRYCCTWPLDCESKLREVASNVSDINPTYIQQEVMKILDSDDAPTAFELMQKVGVLKHIFPGVGTLNPRKALDFKKISSTVKEDVDSIFKLALLLRTSPKKKSITGENINFVLSKQDLLSLMVLLKMDVGENGMSQADAEKKFGNKLVQQILIINIIETSDSSNEVQRRVKQDVNVFSHPERSSLLSKFIQFEQQMMETLFKKWVDSGYKDDFLELNYQFQNLSTK